ncbi:MAG: PH domain-containing protein [Phycisphaerales bacterium]
MPDYPVLRKADFNPAVKSYFMLSTIIVCIVTVVGIVLLPFVLVVGRFLIQKYLDNLSCVLTERTLEVKKGILNKTESTIPLEKITDLQMFQGPIMRHFGLHGFKVETAGQTAGPTGSLLSIIGIVNAPEFRQAVLAQRDALHDGPKRKRSSDTDDDRDPIDEIRDAVLRIEKLLEDRTP